MGHRTRALRAQAQSDKDVAFNSSRRDNGGERYGGVSVFTYYIGVYLQDLEKLDKIPDESLVIHDGSHMAQSKNNVPFKRFYQKNNLDKALMGDFIELKKTMLYLVFAMTPGDCREQEGSNF